MAFQVSCNVWDQNPIFETQEQAQAAFDMYSYKNGKKNASKGSSPRSYRWSLKNIETGQVIDERVG